MLDKIIACKPNSIFDVVPRAVFSVDEETNYLHSGTCFEYNYAIAKALQPKSYLEIGVRYSFSFLPTLLASDSLEYALGYDLETYGNLDVARQNITAHYHGSAQWELQHVDSQQIQELPRFFDLIFIDGDHSYVGKRHDLSLTIGHCKYVWIDDASYLVDVKKAIYDFIDDVGVDGWGKPSLIEWAAFIPCFRGGYLIKYHV